MDKNAIKKFAVWVRTELIARVSLKGVEYGITETHIEDANADSVGGKVLTSEEKKQRQALIAEINAKGYRQVMEEVAYTWFNRFSALRFMEVNGYLPSHVRVFTDEENNFRPQIITEAIHLDLDGLNMEKVYELKEAEKNEELYKYLLIVQCNALNKILPGMFQRLSDYTELLLPDNLLREGSVIQQMIELIPEDDWKDAVQIIGWLYQYYNSEKKADVFAALKKNVKITKENIPAATQLFTQDWIVRYMVENSLGRLWLEGHPDVKSQLLPTEEEQSAYAAGNRALEDTKWHYYLEEAEQEPEVQAQLAEIRKEYATLTPDKLKVIDPCSGSGHILAYMFDVLMKIYESYGYTTREAVASIVENNLYGLDIDDRAAQLAYFAVMMKARQYDRRFFSRGIQPHVYAIVESNALGGSYKYAMGDFLLSKEHQETLNYLMDAFIDAKEYGSILCLEKRDYVGLLKAWNTTASQTTENMNLTIWFSAVEHEVPKLIEQAIILTQDYNVVVTNPPYMGSSGMSAKLSDYVKKYYPDSKSDLFAVFIEHCGQMTKKNGYQAMITQHAWMFLSSFEKLRSKLLAVDIVNMVHLGARAFEEIGGEVVQTTSFVIRKSHIADYKGEYCRLIEPTSQQGKEDMFLAGENRYSADQSSFSKIPGSPVTYWVNSDICDVYNQSLVRNYMDCRSGIMTGDEKFIQFWFETNNEHLKLDCLCAEDMDEFKWFPLNSGGDFRYYFGNNSKVVNLWHDGAEIKENVKNYRLRDKTYYFRKGITWGRISSSKIAFRETVDGSLFGDAGPIGFVETNRRYLLGFLCSKAASYFLKATNPTLNYQVRDVENLPLIIDEKKLGNVEEIVGVNIKVAKNDWDAFEASWDFQHHPLLRKVHTIAEAFAQWQIECDERFNQLKANEEELNRIFIDIYGLQDELTPEVADKDVTVRRADLGRDIRSFISYAVGCMFGRYSLDVDGLAYAGGEWDKVNSSEGGREGTLGCASKYASFAADKDNIIPICDDEYFEDDIVGLFVEFVKTVYGADTLDENLKFIANALGGKGQPKDVIRNYFLSGFYSDHCKIYQKRPIYWLFDSGKKNGFKALIYMHRYQPDTIARIRTDYVHEQQARYRTAIADLEQRIANASTGERVKLKKKLTTLQAQDTEIRNYEEKIHHLADQMISIDLDDGVKKNYAIFQDVLAKIK